MLKWIIRRKLKAFGRENHYDVSHMQELLNADLGAFLKFVRATTLGYYRKDIPLEVHYAAGLTAVIHADCGPCTQLGVNFALKAGLAEATVAAIASGNDAAMSPDVALGVRFARAVIAHDADADTLRAEIVRRWGQRALISLTFAIIAAALYPTLKYGLGHGQACTRIMVGDQKITPRQVPTAAARLA